MSIQKREEQFLRDHFTGVQHTTLNPEGPGVVRIHLVPPRADGDGLSVAILNGMDVVPVGKAWSILLTCFIEEVNRYAGRPVSDEDVESILKATCRAVRKVYPLLGGKRIRDDVHTIMEAFRQIARGEAPAEDVPFLSLGDYAPLMRAPHRMDLMVSAMTKDGRWHCNQQCVHCYAAGQSHAEEPELSTAQWKEIIDRCRAACIPQLTFTGGEPTLRPDLPELIEYAAWFVTRLNTNGIALTPDYCAALRAASLDSLQITFYSADAAVHNALVGAEGFERTAAGIENALAAGLNLSVNTPLCTRNRDYRKTLEYLYEKGVRYVTCSGLITTGAAALSPSEALQLTTEEIREVLREAVDYCYAHEMEISFTSPGWVEPEFCEELGISVPSCGACLSNMAITPGGNVVPCQSWLSDEPLGNMLTDDWATVWDGGACAERRAESAKMEGLCPLRRAAAERGDAE